MLACAGLSRPLIPSSQAHPASMRRELLTFGTLRAVSAWFLLILENQTKYRPSRLIFHPRTNLSNVLCFEHLSHKTPFHDVVIQRKSGLRCLIERPSASAIPDGLNPLNRSQKLNAISKIPIGESNYHRLTTLAKSGKIMKTKVHAAQNTDEITPKTANALGR